MSFDYNLNNDSELLLLSLKGNLINKQQVTNLLADIDFHFNEGVKNVIIDLAEMMYMNSTGLNILVNILTQCRNAGGDVVITNIPEKINKLLIITKLNNVFNIADSLEEAKKQLRILS